MALIGWLVSPLVFLGMRPAFRCLISLRFVAGAAGAFTIALTGASMEAQLVGLAAVSSLTLVFIRSIAFLSNRHVAGKHRRAGGQN